MIFPARTATRQPGIASWPTRNAIAMTMPRSVRRRRTPKFVKLHNGNMHKHTPESLCILPIDNGLRRPAQPDFCLFAILRFFVHSAPILRLSPDSQNPPTIPVLSLHLPLHSLSQTVQFQRQFSNRSPTFLRPDPISSPTPDSLQMNKNPTPAKPDLPNPYPIPYSCSSPPALFDIN